MSSAGPLFNFDDTWASFPDLSTLMKEVVKALRKAERESLKLDKFDMN